MVVAERRAGKTAEDPLNSQRFQQISIMKANNFRPARTREAGFSAIDLMITVMIVALVATLAIARMSVAQEWLRLSRSAQVLSAYADKARLSAVRCHCTTTIQITSTGSFTVTGPLKSATTETLTFPLDKDVTFQGLTLPLTISFDYRGRPDNDYHLTLANARGSRTVDLSGGGDVKI